MFTSIFVEKPMATITKCDKCNKLIRDKFSSESLSFLSMGMGSNIREKYNLSSSLTLCPACSIVVAKYLARFLKTKKTKKNK